ncbi:hypothetical protein RBA71_06740 [Brenneria goodwinii]|uniref:hypothetical protein n=1 Tax=Brenneria goodwinii TaxID=1109412 RepID=UPI0036E32629
MTNNNHLIFLMAAMLFTVLLRLALRRLNVKKTFIFLLYATPVTVLLCLALNFSGFCFENMRPLSREEKITTAIRYILATYPPMINMGNDTSSPDWREWTKSDWPKHPIDYRNIAHFRDVNPDCCKILSWKQFNDYTLLRSRPTEHRLTKIRLTGGAGSMLYVTYKVFYRDTDNRPTSQTVTDRVVISNCGMPW